MDFNDDGSVISPVAHPRVYNYGPAGFDRTHIAKINYLWDISNTPWKSGFAKTVLNNCRSPE